jgi:catechol 2,3-dioxygenase-like lactoylglutathione lyase family enzyme
MFVQPKEGKMAKLRDQSKFDNVDHVAIAVKDIAKAVRWYTERFNCAVEYKDDTWAYLKFENIRLALVIPEQHPAHIAFAVDKAEQHGALETHRDGTRSLYLKDPDGNSVELMDKHSLEKH